MDSKKHIEYSLQDQASDMAELLMYGPITDGAIRISNHNYHENLKLVDEQFIRLKRERGL